MSGYIRECVVHRWMALCVGGLMSEWVDECTSE